MKEKKIIYYEDELNDDFATTVEKIKPLPEKYKYVNNHLYFKIIAFFLYHIILRPFAWCYVKIRFLGKFKNKTIKKELKNTGYFIYQNHTTIITDAFLPSLFDFRKKNYLIAGDQANSLTLILSLTKALGHIPLTTDIKHQKNMMRCIKQRINEKSTIAIFPEAHVWPYYTDIRPFSSEAFKYAVKLNVPVVALTTCFQKRKFRKRPKIVVYADGPFYPDKNLNANENAKIIRDNVYNAMKDRCKNYSTYSYYDYKKKTSE